MACQMAEAVYDATSVTIEAQGRERHLLRASGQVLKFPGWLDAQGASEREEEVAGEEVVRDDHAVDTREEERSLPALAEGEALDAVDPPGVRTEQKFTQPPARYNEGTLVKALEDIGIGRPSTYAEIVSKVLSRDYVEKRERQLVPTKLGAAKTHGLKARFPDVVDYEFTARIERDLDGVEAGSADWVKQIGRAHV